ncbi:MAG TPA: hypothetical protein VGN69_01140 [Solirubrobacteraceae bacterium]|nr:hypothetical protein [Solirubrobacteraceae bacterium]
MNRKTITSLICILLLAVLAAPALGQSPTQSYGSAPIPAPAGTSASKGSGGSGGPGKAATAATATRTVSPSSSKRLPFTGVDVRLVALGGITLLTAGFALRRGTRPSIH